jgi:hypothetical protein
MRHRLIVFLGSAIAIISALFLIVLTFQYPNTAWQFPLFLGLGSALLPAGLFAILSDLGFSELLLGTVVQKVRELADRQVDSVDARVKALAGKLDTSLDTLSKSTQYLSQSSSLGVVMVYPDRRAALEGFLPYVKAYVANETAPGRELVIVASSLLGVIERHPDIGKLFTEVIESAVRSNCDVKILLTHPAYSHYRETQEGRPRYDIAKEILDAIRWVENAGLSSEHIKVYKGTPTTFMIATKEKMLLNFYPYQTEAFNCFCLDVQDTGDDHCIYRSFYDNHFHKPWTGETRKKDHSHQPDRRQKTSLSYWHDYLNGPVSDPDKVLKGFEGPYGDFFVIDDEGTYYIAIDVRGIKREVVYERAPDGAQKTIRIGDSLDVRLLTLRESGQGDWKSVGTIQIDPDSREGYWEQTIREGTFRSLSMLGLFDPDNANAFRHVSTHPVLKDQPLPMLYKWLTAEPVRPSGSISAG